MTFSYLLLLNQCRRASFGNFTRKILQHVRSWWKLQLALSTCLPVCWSLSCPPFLMKYNPSCHCILSNLIGLRFFIWISWCDPFAKVLRQLNLSWEENLSLSEEKGEIAKAKTPWDFVPAGHKIGKPAPLFKELVCHRFFLEIFPPLGHNFTDLNFIYECRKMKM